MSSYDMSKLPILQISAIEFKFPGHTNHLKVPCSRKKRQHTKAAYIIIIISFTIGQDMCFRTFFVLFVSKVLDFLQSLSIPKKTVVTPYLGTDYADKSISSR